MAEWLGTGLQNRLLQFESGWDLKRMLRHPFLIPHRNPGAKSITALEGTIANGFN